jgi:hypothetical protein
MADEIFDKRGIPVKPGDVLKVFHFTGIRNKKYYMYKLAWKQELKTVKLS